MAAAHVQSSGRQPISTGPSTAVAPPSMAGAQQAGRLKDAQLVVAVHNDAADFFRSDVKLVDVASGAIVGQLGGQSSAHTSAAAGLICLVPTGTSGSAVRVFNPATGGVTDIPAGPTAAQCGLNPQFSYVFAQVPATKEYKLLRIVTSKDYNNNLRHHTCDILTLGGLGQRWRPAPSPLVLLSTTIPRHRAVTAGLAHFLTATRTIGYDGIASFDLEKEEWRPSLLQGPLPSESRNCSHSSLSLVELNGCLAFVHHNYLSYCIDMWVLADLGKSTWFKIQSLHLGSILRGWEEPNKGQPVPLIPITRPMKEIFAQPLMMLDDGRIAFWVAFPNSSLRLYDPKTCRCEDVVDMGKACGIVGLYKGSQVGLA
ncbi:unnamed protein product [Urochloa decumbens]|uniref:F-box associated beta-propeller type 3 domain-containing protein n=1 Tax=Urochloa decumbens TaxID=240449 RepID=A0ABC8X781_9POAL